MKRRQKKLGNPSFKKKEDILYISKATSLPSEYEYFSSSDDDFQPTTKRKRTRKAAKQLWSDESLPDSLFESAPTSAVSSTPAVTSFASTSSTIPDKIDKQEALEQSKEEAGSSRPMRCPKCNGTDHAKASSSKCSQRVKQKAKAFKEFSKTSIIKISLAKTCKNPKLVEEIRELIAHIIQVVYAGSIFANYIYLNEVQINHTSEPVSHNLIYQFFSVLTGQGKKASDKIKISFQLFCKRDSRA
ncbi:hypothetical protein INT46_007004 [Mucor plumbeus]|uniref:Uncharacterized protein n=1 Tax=Mucor plumbeus TaxID=97098 RepID=A0A8H7RDR3_9FUNG|nr:hypothetical protein INT46_007004 [Mucor plumbeus]